MFTCPARVDRVTCRVPAADLVLVLRVPGDGATPHLLSVPRDLLVLGDDRGLHRTALTRLQGLQATVDALCQSLGIGAEHLVELDLAGFTKIVDAVGGVDVELPAATRDAVLYEFSFPPGVNHLDGAGALLYVRPRFPRAARRHPMAPDREPAGGAGTARAESRTAMRTSR